MRKWTKTTGLIFLAAASVYPVQVSRGGPAKSAKAAASADNSSKSTNVNLLADQSDSVAPTTAPSTQPNKTSSANSNGSSFDSSSSTPAAAPAMLGNPDG